MKKKVLIFGGLGMLGYSLFNQYLERNDLDVYATLRAAEGFEKWFTSECKKRLLIGIDAADFDTVIGAVAAVKPEVVINCIALIKEPQILRDPLSAISINAQFPHRLALACQKSGIRLIHISSDVVFDGKKGMYAEHDKVSISDLYGMTKFLGEVSYPDCVTIRTSIIGHQPVDKTGLVEWFLSQNVKVRGYTKAIYSGFPAIELAGIIGDYILPRDDLAGVYHVSSEPISKYDLLKLIADRYGKKIEIEPWDGFILDRSLDSSVFRSLTGYKPPSWPELVNKMYIAYNKYNRKT